MLIKRVKQPGEANITAPIARRDINMLKLYTGMATYTLFYIPSVIAAIAVLVVNTAENRSHLPCLILKHLIPLEWCMETITVADMARIGLDSLLGLYFDKRISTGLLCGKKRHERATLSTAASNGRATQWHQVRERDFRTLPLVSSPIRRWSSETQISRIRGAR